MKSISGRRSRNDEIIYDFVISNVAFPTISNSKFRIVSNANSDQAVITLKVEKLKSSQQWQIEIKDITKHGPAGFPKGAIMKAFKQSLEKFAHAEDSDEDEALKSEINSPVSDAEPYIEAEIEDGGGFVLALVVPIMGFPIEFEFKLLPVAREQIDVLETALRDAEDEIARLKTKLKSPTVSLISLRTTKYVNNSIITWNVLENNTAPSLFTLSENMQTVVVKVAGIYQICTRVSAADSGGAREVRVMKNNNITIANAYNGFNTGYNGSVQVNDIVNLNANDILHVYISCNYEMISQQTLHQFWILKLA